MTFVLDASAALSWCFADEAPEATLRIRARLATERAIVPSLWVYEVANALSTAARRGRMSHETATDMARLLMSLPIDTVEPAREPTELMQLAADHELTVYDAAYLQIAIGNSLPLATLDDRLGMAARSVGVRLLVDAEDTR
jgi:predicted nucleic acid-binding protein